MHETQVEQLKKMMSYLPVISHVEVCFPMVKIKKTLVDKLSKGDILPLQTKEISVDIVQDGYIIAQGVYGVYQNTPSVLIQELRNSAIESIHSKKYYTIKISFGTIEKQQVESGKIITLTKEALHDALLYSGEQLLAEAALVEWDHKAALEIREVK
ncbi:MAG: hypothetical protein U9R27_03725 [Campylobacterota bacterium]|nr:hypothetical protein [Campylobacterota bacterium]